MLGIIFDIIFCMLVATQLHDACYVVCDVFIHVEYYKYNEKTSLKVITVSIILFIRSA